MEQAEIKDLSTLLTIASKITEHRYIPLSLRLTYIDVEVSNAEEVDFELCCVISTKSMNGEMFQRYGIFGVHIGPLQLIEHDFIAVIF